MLGEAAQLETLRQKIEDAEYDAGYQSDYLDRGKPNKEQAIQAQALIVQRNAESKALKEELKNLLATLRTQNPHVIEEWVNYHTGILQKIIAEKSTATNAGTRKYVAKETLQNWEKVRGGKLDFVNINWNFLKDYKASVRKGGGTVKKSSNDEKTGDKA